MEEDEWTELGSHDSQPASRDGLVTLGAGGALLHHVQHVGHVQGHVVTRTYKCIVAHLAEREGEGL